MSKYLITGCAGFIGMHLCKSLLRDGIEVIGVDSVNDYYDIKLKEDRLKILKKFKNFTFKKLDISNKTDILEVFEKNKVAKVVNLAAQAGVRYSIENPFAYIESNIVGFINILEGCRNTGVEGLIYASSSSVYGSNEKVPFSIKDRVDNPISIYAASKKSNELMAHAYSHLYGLHTTGLRFFTVYGPWGRPDMAMYIFAKNIIQQKQIPIFNYGNMERDFTYIDDIISGIRSSIDKNYQCEIFNLGNSKVEKLMDVVNTIEDCLGEKAIMKKMRIQPGDIPKTYADIEYSSSKLNFKPTLTINEGIPKFIEWFKMYHR